MRIYAKWGESTVTRHLLAALVAVVLTSCTASAQRPTPEISPTIKDAELRVRLLAPLTTKLNRKGDLVSAEVVEPASFGGAILEGDVREVKGGTAQKSSTIQFQFHTLHIAGKALPVNAAVLNVANSKQQSGIDEDGTVLESDKGTLATGKLSSLGSALGSKLRIGGGKSSSAASTPFRLLTRAPNFSLAVGGEMLVQINQRAGHD
jgi:hypothetical protein